MQFFGNLSIAKRLYLLNIVAAIGLITLSAITIYEATNGLKAQSNAELKHLTRMALSVVESYQTRAQSGEISEDQAKRGPWPLSRRCAIPATDISGSVT